MAIGQYLKQGRIVGKNSSSAGHVVVSLVAALALLMGCTDPGSRAAQESQLDPEPEYSDVSVETRIVDSKNDPGMFSEFFWELVDRRKLLSRHLRNVKRRSRIMDWAHCDSDGVRRRLRRLQLP